MQIYELPSKQQLGVPYCISCGEIIGDDDFAVLCCLCGCFCHCHVSTNCPKKCACDMTIQDTIELVERALKGSKIRRAKWGDEQPDRSPEAIAQMRSAIRDCERLLSRNRAAPA